MVHIISVFFDHLPSIIGESIMFTNGMHIGKNIIVLGIVPITIY